MLQKRKAGWGHLRKLFDDAYGRLMLLPTGQMTGSVLPYMKFLTGREFVSTSHENILRVVHTPWNGKRSLQSKSEWSQQLVTEFFRAVSD